jgi:hypothetical protein
MNSNRLTRRMMFRYTELPGLIDKTGERGGADEAYSITGP